MAKVWRRRKPGTGPTLIQRSREVSPAEKASFHNIEGAGKRGVLREFFGIAPSDEGAIVDRIGVYLEKMLKEQA